MNTAQLYVFKCEHGKHCNFLADCPECAKAEIDRLRAGNYNLTEERDTALTDSHDRVQELLEENDRLRKDAERYHQTLQNILDGNYPQITIGKCAHEKYRWEECTNCIDDYITKELEAMKEV